MKQNPEDRTFQFLFNIFHVSEHNLLKLYHRCGLINFTNRIRFSIYFYIYVHSVIFIHWRSSICSIFNSKFIAIFLSLNVRWLLALAVECWCRNSQAMHCNQNELHKNHEKYFSASHLKKNWLRPRDRVQCSNTHTHHTCLRMATNIECTQNDISNWFKRFFLFLLLLRLRRLLTFRRRYILFVSIN